MIVLNAAWNLVNFRAGLIRALVARGYEVVAVAPYDDYAPRLAAFGARFVALPMQTQGTNPIQDLRLLGRFWRLLRREQPAVYLGYTVKPNVYGSLAAHTLGIPVINNIAGLGAVFINDSWLTRLVRQLYRLALARSARVFFQNQDDLQQFVQSGLVRAAAADRVPGSGIDLDRFQPAPMPADDGVVRFLLIARMLWDKGVGEYVEAARRLKPRYPNTEFRLLGFVDAPNPTAITRQQMDAWVAEGGVSYRGVSDNVASEIAEVDCVVLPSYREGTPRTLLEAAAMARPLITTDTVGCRDVVDDGVNGLLCQPRDAADLAEKMERLLVLPAAERARLGQAGRAKMAREYDERLVIDKYLEAIQAVLNRKQGHT